MAEAADRHQEEGGDTSAGLVVMPLRDGQTGVVVDADVQAVSTGLCSVLAVVSGEAVLGLAKGASFLISRCRTAWFIDQAFPAADTSDFTGSVRCDAVGEGLFSAVALEMDPGNRIFATLPVVPVPERMDRE